MSVLTRGSFRRKKELGLLQRDRQEPTLKVGRSVTPGGDGAVASSPVTQRPTTSILVHGAEALFEKETKKKTAGKKRGQRQKGGQNVDYGNGVVHAPDNSGEPHAVSPPCRRGTSEDERKT